MLEKNTRNLTTMVILSIVTLGIYFLYWEYQMTKFTNLDESQSKRSPVAQLLLCIFIPFYEIYWYYKTFERMDNLVKAEGVPSDNKVLSLLLGIFGMYLPSMLVLQNKVNQYCTMKTGVEAPTSLKGALAVVIVIGVLAIGAGALAGYNVAKMDPDTFAESIFEGTDLDVDDSDASDVSDEDFDIPDYEGDQALLSEATVQKTDDGQWALMAQGRVLTSVCGIGSNEYGSWYIWEGYVDFSYTGPYEDADGNVYNIENGKVVDQAA